MKKLTALSLTLLLSACGGQDRIVETTTVVQTVENDNGMKKITTRETTQLIGEDFEQNEVTKENFEPITFKEIETIIAKSTKLGDELIAFAVTDDGDIQVAIKLADDEQESLEQEALARYTMISDALFLYSGWDRLTMEFVDVGTITTASSEAQQNEDGYYFPEVELTGYLK